MTEMKSWTTDWRWGKEDLEDPWHVGMMREREKTERERVREQKS